MDNPSPASSKGAQPKTKTEMLAARRMKTLKKCESATFHIDGARYTIGNYNMFIFMACADTCSVYNFSRKNLVSVGIILKLKFITRVSDHHIIIPHKRALELQAA